MTFSRTTLMIWLLLAGVSVSFCAEPAVKPDTIEVSPASIEFRHHRNLHSVQVFGTNADGYSADLRAEARITSADPKVVVVDEHGLLRPVGTGETKVNVVIGNQTKTIAVKAALPAVEPATSFRHEVMPVSTAGCNQGSCHGYSLARTASNCRSRGQDADADYVGIVREFAARRLNYQDPSASLLITKGRGAVSHEGGVRFGADRCRIPS